MKESDLLPCLSKGCRLRWPLSCRDVRRLLSLLPPPYLPLCHSRQHPPPLPLLVKLGGGCVNERCGGGLHQIPADRSIISFMAMAYEFSSPVLHLYIYL